MDRAELRGRTIAIVGTLVVLAIAVAWRWKTVRDANARESAFAAAVIRAQTEELAGRFEAAYAAWREAGAIVPERPEPTVGAGRVLVPIGRLDEAIAILRPVATTPAGASALAHALALKGDLPGAAQVLQPAHDAAPTELEVLERLAQIRAALGEGPAADKLFRALVEARPPEARAVTAVEAAQALRRASLQDEASAFVTWAREHGADSPALALDEARMLAGAKRFDAALVALDGVGVSGSLAGEVDRLRALWMLESPAVNPAVALVAARRAAQGEQSPRSRLVLARALLRAGERAEVPTTLSGDDELARAFTAPEVDLALGLLDEAAATVVAAKVALDASARFDPATNARLAAEAARRAKTARAKDLVTRACARLRELGHMGTCP